MLIERRGPAISKRTALMCLLLCSLLIAGLIGWNLASTPTLKAPDKAAQVQMQDYNAVFDYNPSTSGGSPTKPASPGPGPAQSLLPNSAASRPNSAVGPTPTPIQVERTSKPIPSVTPEVLSYPANLLGGVQPTPTAARSQPNLTAQQLDPNTTYNQSLSNLDLSGPSAGRITARGAELVDANGARYFVAGVNYEGHTDRAWLMWQNDRFDPALVSQNFATAAAGGYNTIRIFVQSQLRNDVLANNWSKLDKVAEIAQRYGLRLLITLGDYYELDLNKLIDVDISIARHFAGSNTIMGYDLRNEPQISELVGAIYPPGQQPPLQSEDIIKIYGERVSQSESEGRRNQIPAHLNSRQAYIYTNVMRYWEEFSLDIGYWVNRNGRMTAMDFFNSPDTGKWQPFIDALNGTVQKYIDVRQNAIHLADPGRLVTVGWNRPALARMPANRSLGFVSFHHFPGDSAGGLAATLAMLDSLKNFYSGKPVIMEEFGYSNSDGKNSIPNQRTASYEASIWLFLYGRGYAGGFKWMLNNFTIGANPYENNFGLLDNNTQPKPAFYAARSILQQAAANRTPSGDFDRLESYDGVTIFYTWGSNNAFFGNNKDFKDDRVQINQAEASPWAIWWPNNGQGQVYISLTGPGQVVVNLRAIFPTWKAGMRPVLALEDGSPAGFDQRGDAIVAFNAQPGALYTLRAPVQPAAFNRASPLNAGNTTYFKETGHNLSNFFKRYWESKGGLAIYGFPVSEEFQENGFTVQYFERARFEYHPEHSGTPSEVQLGLLGNLITAGRRDGGEPPFQPIAPFNNSANAVYFKETGHGLKGGFKAFWEANGGLAQFGYSISEEFFEVNPADGKTYTVQYFERNRFEFHPEFTGTRAEFQLGLLGLQVVKARGWLQ